ncbi:MAG: multicopper oxidase family protein [Planctomycetes bacterium]|nr:multicopper oxidase family protein [Planctomycetota bacterium]
MRNRILCAVALSATLATSQTTLNVVAAPGTATFAPGVTGNAWLFNGTLPGSTLRVTQGQTLRVRFRNDLPESTALHWHGQPVPLGMDGVPGVSRPAVAPGQEFVYELTNLIPGTHWYHPHGHAMQLDMGLAGLVIVDPANPADDPPYDVEQVVVLDEWSNPLGGFYTGHLLNGKSSDGQIPIAVQPGQRLRLRILNASAVTNYVLALDGHPMTVTHTDGGRVQPVVVQALPIGIGERYDVIVDCNNPGVWSLAAAAITNRSVTLVRGVLRYAGQTQAPPPANFVPPNLSSGALLSYAQLAAYFPVPPISPAPRHRFTATFAMSMGPGGMVHTINGQSWPNVTPFQVALGDVVELTMVNTAASLVQGLHPMHTHGHSFRLLNTAGGTTQPPVKDTILIRSSGQPGSTAVVQLVMDNPGLWLFHCHNEDHMASGMITAFEYLGDTDADGIADGVDHEPTTAVPVTEISDMAADFAPGASGDVSVQWTAGQLVDLFAGLSELSTPLVFPPYGTLVLDPSSAAFFGGAWANASHRAIVSYAIPNDVGLIGLRIAFQSVGLTALPGGFRLGTAQALTIR